MKKLIKGVSKSMHKLELEFLNVNWNKFGLEDPLWAVSTAADKRWGGWALKDFFEEGEGTIAYVMDHLKSLRVPLRFGRALDFGCGVGRLTQALAKRFETIYGIDIAESMIEKAKELCDLSNVKFMANRSKDLKVFASNHFDFIITLITLQHIPKDLALGYISEFVRVAKPGGVITFHVPAKWVDPKAPAPRVEIPQDPAENVEKHGPIMLMSGIPKSEVIKLLHRCGADVVDVIENTWSGPEWLSYHYYAVKK